MKQYKFKDKQEALEHVDFLLHQAEMCLAQGAICDSAMLKKEADRFQKEAYELYAQIKEGRYDGN